MAIVGWTVAACATFSAWVVWNSYRSAPSIWWEPYGDDEQELIDKGAAYGVAQAEEYNRRKEFTRQWLDGADTKEG